MYSLWACMLAIYGVHSMPRGNSSTILSLFTSHGPMAFNFAISCSYMVHKARVAHGCIAGGGVMYLFVVS